MPGLDPAASSRTWLHPTLFVSPKRPLVILDGGCTISPFDCIALVQAGRAHTRVLRLERGMALINDPVLAGKTTNARFVAHWIIRLAAVEEGIGWTDTILISAPATSSTMPLIRRLQAQGAHILALGPSVH